MRRDQCFAERETVAVLQSLMFKLVFRTALVTHIDIRGIEPRAELARTTLHSITPPPTNDEQQEPEIESDEPASYRVEIDRCPLYLSIEAKSGTSAIQKAIDLVRLVTKNETEGLRLPLGEPGDHDADAIIYPSFDAKDFGIADIEPMV